MKAIVRKEIHLSLPAVKGLTKEAKLLNISLKKHMETVLEGRIRIKKTENANS